VLIGLLWATAYVIINWELKLPRDCELHHLGLTAFASRPCIVMDTENELDVTQEQLDGLDLENRAPNPAAAALGAASREEHTPVEGREAGKSLLPMSRVQKIIKADEVRCAYSALLFPSGHKW
jgi:hypothetical protein